MMKFPDALFCWSLSAKDGVPAPVRERATLPDAEKDSLLASWRRQRALSVPGEGGSLLYVGTCHRVEIYGWGLDPDMLLVDWEKARGVSLASARLRTGAEVIRHFVRVVASLESEVLGETQIAGQMKDAATQARACGHLHGSLDWAVQQALRVAKSVRHSTQIGRGTVSVAHVAVDGLSDFFDDLNDKRVLLVGGGSMAVQALSRLRSRGATQITWMNRTADKILCHPLSRECRVVSFEELHAETWRHEVTLVATRVERPLVTLEGLQQARRALRRQKISPCSGPRVLLDLGLPRNVEPTLHGHDGFYVRDVDEFHNRADQGRAERVELVGRAEELIETELISILKLAEARGRGPLLQELKDVLERWFEPVLASKNLEKSDDLEYISRSVHSKLTHRLLEELNRIGEPQATQVLESLLKAWRHPDSWPQNEPQQENPNLPAKKPAKARLARR